MNKNKIISLCLTALLVSGSLRAMDFIQETPENDPKWLGDQLVNAATFGDLDRIQELLRKGAAINHKCYMGSDFDTALMEAARKGHLPAARLLIQNGAQINIADKAGWTALMFAAANGHLDICKLFIDAMLKPTKQQKDQTYAQIASLERTPQYNTNKDTRALLAQTLANAHKKENKQIAITEINKIRDEDKAIKQELLRYVNGK